MGLWQIVVWIVVNSAVDSAVESAAIVPLQAMGLESLKCASVFSAKRSGAQLFTEKGEQG